jgi:hypothetical protein
MLKGGVQRKARKSSKKAKVSRKSKTTAKHRHHDKSLIRTAKILSRKTHERRHPSRATPTMSMTDLQFMAKSRGIPFGGLTKMKLVKKINNYY